MLQTFLAQTWTEKFNSSATNNAIESLEQGQILYFPTLSFALKPEEEFLLSPDHADPRSKNIGYHPTEHTLWGVHRLTDAQRLKLKAMLDRFFRSTHTLIKNILPHYLENLIVGRTSFRPLQISGRKTSYRKDDKRLHVDAFPSAPNQGKRILRVFCNINPANEDRVWRVGEAFERVAQHFLPRVPKPFPGTAALLRLLKITKSYRTAYDHYMLHLHDQMKADEDYQKKAEQQQLFFRPGCSWIVQTDHVSHAAMAGQYVLEQTFYLPVHGMQNPAHSPLRTLEKLLDRKLI